jgi:hypothetical protein
MTPAPTRASADSRPTNVSSRRPIIHAITVIAKMTKVSTAGGVMVQPSGCVLKVA